MTRGVIIPTAITTTWYKAAENEFMKNFFVLPNLQPHHFNIIMPCFCFLNKFYRLTIVYAGARKVQVIVNDTVVQFQFCQKRGDPPIRLEIVKRIEFFLKENISSICF